MPRLWHKSDWSNRDSLSTTKRPDSRDYHCPDQRDIYHESSGRCPSPDRVPEKSFPCPPPSCRYKWISPVLIAFCWDPASKTAWEACCLGDMVGTFHSCGENGSDHRCIPKRRNVAIICGISRDHPSNRMAKAHDHMRSTSFQQQLHIAVVIVQVWLPCSRQHLRHSFGPGASNWYWHHAAVHTNQSREVIPAMMFHIFGAQLICKVEVFRQQPLLYRRGLTPPAIGPKGTFWSPSHFR